MADVTQDRLWTVDEVARYLGVSRATVYRLPIRFVKIGKSRRYDQADVRHYLMLNESRATDAAREKRRATA